MLFGLLWLPVILLGFVFWIWMLVDCATKEASQGNDKLVWTLIILFTNVIGAFLYWAARRPQRIEQLGR